MNVFLNDEIRDRARERALTMIHAQEDGVDMKIGEGSDSSLRLTKNQAELQLTLDTLEVEGITFYLGAGK